MRKHIAVVPLWPRIALCYDMFTEHAVVQLQLYMYMCMCMHMYMYMYMCMYMYMYMYMYSKSLNKGTGGTRN